MKNLSLRRMTDLLSVVQPYKRPELKRAIEQGQRILVAGDTLEGKALLDKLKEYDVPHSTTYSTYYFKETP